MKFPNPVIDVAIEPKTKADQDKLAIALQKLPGRGSDLPGADGRRDRPDHHRRHGRAAPRDHRRPDEARVQGRGQRRQAAGGVPRDDPQAGRGRRGQVHPPVGRQGPVRPRGDRRGAGRAGRAASSSRTRSSAASSRASSSSRWRRASSEALENGVLAGYPMVDVKATLIYGSYHDVDSSRNGVQDRRLDGLQGGGPAGRGRSCSSRSWRSRW